MSLKFAVWLVKASNRQMIPTVWLVGVLGVILCNVAGTNIGATILLTKIVHAAQLPASSEKAAALALAVSNNISAVSFTFSASLAAYYGNQKGTTIKQATFAFWNMLPFLMMTNVGLSVVTAIMVVLYWCLNPGVALRVYAPNKNKGYQHMYHRTQF